MDFVEGEVLGGAGGFPAPGFEEAAVAEGDETGGIDVEPAAGGVDPVGRAFELGVDADGGFVENAVAGGVGELGAVFLVDEGGSEAEAGEDLAEGVAVLHFGFDFFAVLVAGAGVVILGEGFPGEDPALAVAADAEDGGLGAEAAVGGVVEDVALEGAGGLLVEAGIAEEAAEGVGIGDGEFDFDFAGHRDRVQRSVGGRRQRGRGQKMPKASEGRALDEPTAGQRASQSRANCGPKASQSRAKGGRETSRLRVKGEPKPSELRANCEPIASQLRAKGQPKASGSRANCGPKGERRARELSTGQLAPVA